MYIFTEQSQGVLSLSGADLSNMKLSYKKQLGTVDFGQIEVKQTCTVYLLGTIFSCGLIVV